MSILCANRSAFSEPQNMEFKIGYDYVNRVEALEDFFEKYNSPLKENSSTFVAVADKYNMDYTLLPAISCMESTCGRALIEGTYNPFGWGIYGDNYISFKSYDNAIETVGKEINKNYIQKGYDTAEKIAPIYAPPNSHNWSRGVRFFTNKIGEMAIKS